METLTSWLYSSDDPDARREVPKPGEDPYEQEYKQETEELRRETLELMEMALEKIPPQDKTGWDQAKQKCDPILINQDHKLLFLRMELFNFQAAAERLVRYWHHRVEVFGPSKAFGPLTLAAGALDGDEAALETGFIRLLPSCRDPVGRPVLFLDPSRHFPGTYPRESMVRVFWYMVHCALEPPEPPGDESNQEDDNNNNNNDASVAAAAARGVVFVGYPRNVQLSQFDPKLIQANIGYVKSSLPLRLSGMHVCHPPSFFGVIFPVVQYMLASYLKHLHVHQGSDEQVLEQLSVFGLPKQGLPTELGGDFQLDHSAWLQERRSKGL